MKKFFRVELRTPLPLEIVPRPFKYDVTMMDGEAVVTVNYIAANRVQEVVSFLHVFFPKLTHTLIWEESAEGKEVPIEDITDVGMFNEGTMRVLMPISELIDLQVLLGVNAQVSGVVFDSTLQASYEISMEVVSSRLNFTRGDDIYVGMFAAKMIEKLRNSGRSGWQVPEFPDFEIQMRMQKAIIERDFVSLANYAMFAYWRGVAPWSA